MKHLAAYTVLLAMVLSCGRKSSEVRPERRDITETVFASGSLQPDYVYDLTAQTEGIIASLDFDEGDTVKKDELLAVVDNKVNDISAASAEQLLRIAELNSSPQGPVLKQAGQNVQLTRAKLSEDSVLWQRYEKLYGSNAIAKVEVERYRLAYETSRTAYLNALESYHLQQKQAEQQEIMQRSQKQISQVSNSYNEIRAILPGRVYRRLKEKGDYVRRGELIAVIGDPRKFYAKLSVDETNIGLVRTGQEAVVQLNTEKEKSYRATITEVYPAFDEATQSFACRADFIQPPAFRVYGTQLQANIVIAHRKNALVIPKAYYNYGGQVNVKGKGKVTIKAGFVSGEWVEVLSGIDENTVLTTQ